jgi:hypothetical protein
MHVLRRLASYRAAIAMAILLTLPHACGFTP